MDKAKILLTLLIVFIINYIMLCSIIVITKQLSYTLLFWFALFCGGSAIVTFIAMISINQNTKNLRTN